MLKESLKDAICNEDIDLLQANQKEYSIDDRFEDENNDTLLLYALSDGKSKAYEFFLGNGADTTATNGEGENVIHSIVYSGDAARLGSFLNTSNINHQSNDGTTPLLLAIGLGNDEMALALIKEGPDIHLCDCEGNSPLHLASFFGQLDVVKILVEGGANLEGKTTKGNKPLALAVNEGHDPVVKYLFKMIYECM